MFEVRIHGRGGQGVVSSAEMLSVAAFREGKGGLDAETALFEAQRCMSCGSCFECDNCFGVCPDNAIVKLGPGYRIEVSYDVCKGCAMCAKECLCGAIQMVPEEA